MVRVNDPYIGDAEKKYVMEALETGWISSEGPMVKKFEENFSSYLGASHGVAVSNGTAGLEAALFGLGIKEGDEVILPSFTIISCVLACLRLKAKPVLVDIDPKTWCIDTNLIEEKITDKTKVIMPVHMYGHPCDMDPIMALAKKYKLKVLEDAAEVHGAKYKDKFCGSIGDASSFSFYANKLITTGEGGMVITSDDQVAKRASEYRNLCFIPEQRFLHKEIGYNFRMTNIQAAIGVGQLERLDQIVESKRELGQYYGEKLKDIDGVQAQVEMDYATSVYWMYCIQLDPKLGLTAKEVMDRLAKEDVGTRPFFLGMHQQPAFHELGLFIDESYPVTEQSAEYGLYLPSGMTLTKDQIDFVVEKLKKVLAY